MTSPIDDLRAAVAKADEVFECHSATCAFNPCEEDSERRYPCVCLNMGGAQEAVVALYKAAKSVVEPRNDAAAKASLSEMLGIGNTFKTCWCYRCIDEPSMGLMNPATVRMILCPECGNKRCPRASDHNNACTGSNELGQEGSVYR